MKRIIANTGEKRKKRLQPQRRSAETQPLLLALALHARTPNSSEPLPHGTRTHLLDQSAVLALGQVLRRGHPMRGARGWLRVRKSWAGLLCVPSHLPARLPQHQHFHRYLPALSSSPHTQAPFLDVLLQEIGIYGNRVSKRHATNFSGTQTQFPKGR